MTVVTSSVGAVPTIAIDRPQARNAVDPATAALLPGLQPACDMIFIDADKQNNTA
jgi:1,4-dihydroxy-2-naphthoyl-CoA synthase